jgi:POT family proton-dependent oligopeptide transporter
MSSTNTTTATASDTSSASETPSSVPAAPGQKAGFKHPAGLFVLFFTEMWERFSYYGMRALLVLFLVEHHGWQPQQANGVYKWYTSLVYLTPLFGGLLADRLLGLRASIIIGGVLMACGQFLLVFEPLPMFYTALGLLIIGNGFFKPNISTLVGRMYKPGDSRRDGAFTIFYMGINLGAFFAPLICGQWLRAKYDFKYGFAAAGIGMVLGLIIFITFQGRIKRDVEAAGNSMAIGAKDDAPSDAAKKDEEDERQPSATGPGPMIARGFGVLATLIFGVVLPILSIVRLIQGQATVSAVFMPVAVGGISLWMAYTLIKNIRGASRDKSTVIFILFVFVVLFWMAFEQAGSALNLWARFHTQRQVVGVTMEAEAYQSLNAAGIFILAPVFAILWAWLNRVGKEPSTPAKMGIAMVFITLAFFSMVGSAIAEHRTETRIALAKVPSSIDLAHLDAGRMTHDPATGELTVKGVLPDYVVKDALQKSADPAYVAAVEALAKASQEVNPGHPVSMVLPNLPAEYGPSSKELEKYDAHWAPETSTMSVGKRMDAPARIALAGAGAPAEWRRAITQLAEKSNAAAVSGLWLFLSYLLATIGELCLSPVGLSMVTKLAPTRYASLFMGVWLLSSSVAQYAGGSIGESWGEITPTQYFWFFVFSSAAGAFLLFLLVRPIRRLMHAVR